MGYKHIHAQQKQLDPVIQYADFGAKVLKIVHDAKAKKQHYQSAQTKLAPYLELIKQYVFKIISTTIGGELNYHQDVLECQLCKTKFRRNQERHKPSCPFWSKPIQYDQP